MYIINKLKNVLRMMVNSMILFYMFTIMGSSTFMGIIQRNYMKINSKELDQILSLREYITYACLSLIPLIFTVLIVGFLVWVIYLLFCGIVCILLGFPITVMTILTIILVLSSVAFVIKD